MGAPARRRAAAQALRPHRRRRRAELRRPGGQRLRLPGPQRCRQDDHAADPARADRRRPRAARHATGRVAGVLDRDGFHPGRTARDELALAAARAGRGDPDEALERAGLTAIARPPHRRVLVRHAPAAGGRRRAAEGARRPAARRAGDRARPARAARPADAAARARGTRGGDGAALQPRARRGRGDLRPRDRRQPRPARRRGPARRAARPAHPAALARARRGCSRRCRRRGLDATPGRHRTR